MTLNKLIQEVYNSQSDSIGIQRNKVAHGNQSGADDFFHDSLDFLHRYRITVEHFLGIKSKRMKLFLDLRMAAECILKAKIALIVVLRPNPRNFLNLSDPMR